jgi:hypothetical protein
VLACHSNARNDADCWTRLAELMCKPVSSTLRTYYNFTNYAAYIDNDSCVKTMINSQYWETEPDPPTPPAPTPEHDDDDYDSGLLLSLRALSLAYFL